MTKLATKRLTTNLPNIKSVVSLLTRQRRPAKTLMKASVVLAHHQSGQSGFALDFVKSYTNITRGGINESRWRYTTINYNHYFFSQNNQ